MVGLHQVERLLASGETAQSYFGEELCVVTTTTIPDELLQSLSRNKERNLVIQFNPDFHIAGDVPIYHDYTVADRSEIINQAAENISWLSNELSEEDIEIIPTIKGTDPTEREIWYDKIDYLDPEYFAYSGIGYSEFGIAVGDLLDEIHEIHAETDPKLLIVIGIQNKELVKELPPRAIGVAGQSWIRLINGKDSSTTHPSELDRWKTQIDRLIQQKQAQLRDFTTTNIQMEILSNELNHAQELLEKEQLKVALLERAAFFNDYLQGILVNKFRKQSEEGLSNQHKRYLQNLPFKNCIHLAYLNGLLLKEEHDVMNDLRSIRNNVAHEYWEPTQHRSNDIRRVLNRTDRLIEDEIDNLEQGGSKRTLARQDIDLLQLNLEKMDE